MCFRVISNKFFPGVNLFSLQTLIKPNNKQSCHHVETSQLIYEQNQMTGFCIVIDGFNLQQEVLTVL